MTAIGAERQHVILPMDPAHRPRNGHSRYGDQTARFAPERHSVKVIHLQMLELNT
jgi:hypothetical protein